MKYFLIIGLLIVFSNPLRSQGKDGFASSKLWIKAQQDSAKMQQKSRSETKTDLFNFNPVIKKSDILFKNILNDASSLFIVFKSDIEEEKNVATLLYGKEKTFVTNKQIVSDEIIEYKKVDSKNGMVLSYLYNKQEPFTKRKNTLLLDIAEDIEYEKNGKEQFLELLYFPKVLNVLERRKVETYLSLKYGISLKGNYDYINALNDTIWAYKTNKLYNNRVTGIGRADIQGLYQKQSGNSEKDGLYIGLGMIEEENKNNKNSLKNNSYLIWGDNGKSSAIAAKRNTSLNDVVKMDRIWKMEKSKSVMNDTILTQVRVLKNEMKIETKPEDKDRVLWMVVSNQEENEFDYNLATYYKQIPSETDTVQFKVTPWSKTALFTFVKAPNFFADIKGESPNCLLEQQGKMHLKFVGGKAPYTVRLISKKINKEYTINSDHVVIDNLIPNEYNVVITDNTKQIYQDIITINSFDAMQITLAENWYMNNGNKAEILPILHNTNEKELSYEWIYQSKTIGTDKKFTADVTGDYIFRVNNSEGCFKEFPFRVLSDAAALESQLLLYPNPVQAGGDFSILFKLKQLTDVEIKIYDFNGKLIRIKNLGQIKMHTHIDTINIQGTFLVLVSINGKTTAQTLIVR